MLLVNSLSCWSWSFSSWSQLQHLHGLVLSKSPVAGSLTGEEAVPWVKQACVTRVPCGLVLQSCLGTVLHRLDSQLCNLAGPSLPVEVQFYLHGKLNLESLNREKEVPCLLT